MRLRIVIILALCLVAFTGGWFSMWDHATTKAILDARSADGDVESYTAAFHARAVSKARLLALIAVCAAGILVVLRSRFDRWSFGRRADARAFAADLRASLIDLRRSRGRWAWAVMLLILVVVAALRARLLGAAITYDEAFTCTYYAVRPWYIIVSDYSYPNNHILHTLLVKGSLGLLGWGELQARLPAFLAGILALALFWQWMRVEFGETAATPALALAILCVPLVEYGSMARGYSITWSALLGSLLLARHWLRTGNRFTLVLLAAANALGCWAVPTMLYGSLAVFAWMAGAVWRREAAARARGFRDVVMSVGGFLASVILLYAPVVIVYGPGQLFYDETMGPRSFGHFTDSISDRAAAVVGSPWLVALIAFALVAALWSARYRSWLVALALAIVPMLILQRMIGPPRIWTFLLFFLLAAPGIVLQQVLERRPLRRPVLVAVLLAFAALTWLTVQPGNGSGVNRFTGAREAAAWLKPHLEPTDRVLVNVPCEAPLEFYFNTVGLGIEPLYRRPRPGSRLWFVLGTDHGHTSEELAGRAKLPPGSWEDPRPVRELDGIAIFAARYGEQAP